MKKIEKKEKDFFIKSNLGNLLNSNQEIREKVLSTFSNSGAKDIFYMSKNKIKNPEILKTVNNLIEKYFDLEIIERRDNLMYMSKKDKKNTKLTNFIKNLKKSNNVQKSPKNNPILNNNKKIPKNLTKKKKKENFKKEPQKSKKDDWENYYNQDITIWPKYYKTTNSLNPYKNLKKSESPEKSKNFSSLKKIRIKERENLPKKIGKICFKFTNNFLQISKKKKMKWSENLFKIALRHSFDMATKKVNFGHFGFEIRNLLILENHKSPTRENVAYLSFNFGIEEMARKVVDGWVLSDGHRRNILGGNAFSAVAGVYREEDNVCFFTQLFAD